MVEHLGMVRCKSEIDKYEHHKQLVHEVCLAYCERPPQAKSHAYGDLDPCFHFTTSGWFTDGVALRLAYEAMDSNTTFDAEAVTPATRKIGEECVSANVAVGRFNHPVLFVESSDPYTAQKALEEVAVNVAGAGTEDVGVCRDLVGNGGPKPHTPCDHGEPPVHVEDEAEPVGDMAVIRAAF